MLGSPSTSLSSCRARVSAHTYTRRVNTFTDIHHEVSLIEVETGCTHVNESSQASEEGKKVKRKPPTATETHRRIVSEFSAMFHKRLDQKKDLKVLIGVGRIAQKKT